MFEKKSMSRNALCFSINFDMGNLNLFSNIQDVSTQSDPHRVKCLLNRWAPEESRWQQQQQRLGFEPGLE
jgi:hypothetical protein